MKTTIKGRKQWNDIFKCWFRIAILNYFSDNSNISESSPDTSLNFIFYLLACFAVFFCCCCCCCCCSKQNMLQWIKALKQITLY